MATARFKRSLRKISEPNMETPRDLRSHAAYIYSIADDFMRTAQRMEDYGLDKIQVQGERFYVKAESALCRYNTYLRGAMFEYDYDYKLAVKRKSRKSRKMIETSGTACGDVYFVLILRGDKITCEYATLCPSDAATQAESLQSQSNAGQDFYAVAVRTEVAVPVSFIRPQRLEATKVAVLMRKHLRGIKPVMPEPDTLLRYFHGTGRTKLLPPGKATSRVVSGKAVSA